MLDWNVKMRKINEKMKKKKEKKKTLTPNEKGEGLQI